MKGFCLARLCLILFSANLFSTLADTLVIRKELENEEDPGASFLPFNVDDGARMQMLYPAEYFIEAMPIGGAITEVAFRLDGPRGNPGDVSLNTAIKAFELRLSTSPSFGPDIPVEFARNVGKDETTVFSKGLLVLKSSWNPEGPNPFSLRIPFEREFNYDPRAGNLLLDIFIHEGRLGGRIFTEFSGGGGVVGGPITSTSGTQFGPSISALQVTFMPVPEPGLLVILALGLLLIPSRRAR